MELTEEKLRRLVQVMLEDCRRYEILTGRTITPTQQASLIRACLSGWDRSR